MSETRAARTDRLDELEDFILALDEWGVEKHEDRVTAITGFLQSPTGLTQYLERDVAEIVGHA